MKHLYLTSLKAVLFATLTLALCLFSCEKQGLMAPQGEHKVMRSTRALTFLKSTATCLQKGFTSLQYVTMANGGTLTAGNDSSGYSSLFFKPGDLPVDTTIVFSWDSQGYITDLNPHGIVFNTPVAIHLSYKDADLSQVDENTLRIWYFDENVGDWELIGGTVNTVEKRVEGFIDHFSRYAVAAE